MLIILAQQTTPGTTTGGATQSPAPAAPGAAVQTAKQWDWATVVRLSFEGGGLRLDVGPVGWMFLLACGVALAGWAWKGRKLLRRRRYDVVKTKLRIANLGEVELCPNNECLRIAYQAWVELKTRKAGLPFDEDHDVIAEVYNSWYELFGRLRDLVKSIPAHQLRDCPDTRKLVDWLVRVLNEGLRPHLTRWQAKFRRWYEHESSQHPGLPPQELQRRFPEFVALVKDLKEVNVQLVEYAAWLRTVAEGEQTPIIKDLP